MAGGVRQATVALGAAVAIFVPATGATAAAPRACAVLTTSIAASLLKEQPRTIASTQLVCQYGRSSERASTTRSTVGLTIVRNASVTAAQAAQQRLVKIAPTKAPPRHDGLRPRRPDRPRRRGDVRLLQTAGGPIVGGFVFLRIGVYTAQLTPDVRATGGHAFTAVDLKRAASQLAARWAKTG